MNYHNAVINNAWAYKGIRERNFKDTHKLLTSVYTTVTDANGDAFVPVKDPQALIRVMSSDVRNYDLEINGSQQVFPNRIEMPNENRLYFYKDNIKTIKTLKISTVSAESVVLNNMYFMFNLNGIYHLFHQRDGFVLYNPTLIYTDFGYLRYDNINAITQQQWLDFYTADLVIYACVRYNYISPPELLSFTFTYTKADKMLFDITDTNIGSIATDATGTYIKSRRKNREISVRSHQVIRNVFPSYLYEGLPMRTGVPSVLHYPDGLLQITLDKDIPTIGNKNVNVTVDGELLTEGVDYTVEIVDHQFLNINFRLSAKVRWNSEIMVDLNPGLDYYIVQNGAYLSIDNDIALTACIETAATITEMPVQPQNALMLIWPEYIPTIDDKFHLEVEWCSVPDLILEDGSILLPDVTTECSLVLRVVHTESGVYALTIPIDTVILQPDNVIAVLVSPEDILYEDIGIIKVRFSNSVFTTAFSPTPLKTFVYRNGDILPDTMYTITILGPKEMRIKFLASAKIEWDDEIELGFENGD